MGNGTLGSHLSPGRLSSIRHVRQEDPYGCQYACMAMILGASYANVRAALGDPGNGKTYHLWHNWLARHGFAYQHVFKFDCAANADRSEWPLKPWAEAHVCAVDAGNGEGSHNVILLRDATVFDPVRSTPTRWEDYSGVSYMGAIYDVGVSPTPS